MNKKFVTALVADADGNVFDLEGYAAVGWRGGIMSVLEEKDMIKTPFGSEVMFLPDRKPVLYNVLDNRIETLDENPFAPGEPIYPVAVFNSPGFVNTYTSAYEEKKDAGFLPLFPYGAVGWAGDFYVSAAFQVDDEPRQDLRLMPIEKVQKGVTNLKKKFPKNRLFKHITNCALVYGCPAAKNFFLARYEAPLPTSTTCNARCLGCISLQSGAEIRSCQNRITFVPTAQEISEIALHHIAKVKKAVVSFGQGCEGDPLFAAKVIIPAVKFIKKETDLGTVNMNTNASLPDVIEKLSEAGLDSIRVSMNSAREKCYDAYFRPVSYTFDDVKKSIDIFGGNGGFISLNYLNCPGVTDSEKEAEALMSFLSNHPVNFIQWRNLNFDPQRYYKMMKNIDDGGLPIGMDKVVAMVRAKFPHVGHGYFNPPKERFKAIAEHGEKIKM
ncbi:radical SAM protein [Desulforegula conservatrix]|uniref:radical SAM protein n=1 Tax=Desulforegula conservatrix TaxID=153026 RepID=UPI0004083012|nr:radical SAM protein [Desulforegula conservatrix]